MTRQQIEQCLALYRMGFPSSTALDIALAPTTTKQDAQRMAKQALDAAAIEAETCDLSRVDVVWAAANAAEAIYLNITGADPAEVAEAYEAATRGPHEQPIAVNS